MMAKIGGINDVFYSRIEPRQNIAYVLCGDWHQLWQSVSGYDGIAFQDRLRRLDEPLLWANLRAAVGARFFFPNASETVSPSCLPPATTPESAAIGT